MTDCVRRLVTWVLIAVPVIAVPACSGSDDASPNTCEWDGKTSALLARPTSTGFLTYICEDDTWCLYGDFNTEKEQAAWIRDKDLDHVRALADCDSNPSGGE